MKPGSLDTCIIKLLFFASLIERGSVKEEKKEQAKIICEVTRFAEYIVPQLCSRHHGQVDLVAGREHRLFHRRYCWANLT